jgi:cytochrome P450
MGWEWNVFFANCTESWRLARKLLDRSLRPAGIAAYRPLLQTKAYALLSQVLATPEDLEAHLNRFVAFVCHASGFSEYSFQLPSLSGSVVLAMGYGYEVKDLNDKTVKAAKTMVKLMGEIALPGALLVNILPFCESLLVFNKLNAHSL